MNKNKDYLKIVWICHYPAYEFRYREKLKNSKISHPTSWVQAQAPLLAAKAEIELHIITIGKDFLDNDEFTNNGIHFHFLKIPRIPRFLFLYTFDRLAINRVIEKIQPDLIHGFGTEAGYAFTAALSKYPTIIEIQGIIDKIMGSMGPKIWIQHPERIIPYLLEKFTIYKGRYFNAPTNFAAAFVKKNNPKAKIYQIKTPVRKEFFESQPITLLNLREPILIFIGTVIPEKGVHILLQSFSKVVEIVPKAKLHIVGKINEQYFHSEITPLIEKNDLNEKVIFHGYSEVEDIISFLQKSAILILPTFMDTSPNVIVEAQIMGIPVIASQVGGIPEMITHGETGLLAQCGSSESFTQAILHFLQNPDIAEACSKNARNAALNNHDLHKQVNKLVSAYHEILS